MNAKEAKELLGVLLELESGLSAWELNFIGLMDLAKSHRDFSDWEMGKITEIYDERCC